MCLEAADWSFTSTYAALPEALLPPGMSLDPDLPHHFILPGQCLTVREAGDRHTRWRRDGSVIRADQAGPLPVRYTARTDAENALPSGFRLAVSYRLAALLAPIWEGTATRLEQLERRAEAALKKAAGHDAAQASTARYDGRDHQPDWADWAVR